MPEPFRFRFDVHRTQPADRLVLRDDGSFSDGITESKWQLAWLRDEGDVNADVRAEIAANGYCLFAIGLKLDAIKQSQR